MKHAHACLKHTCESEVGDPLGVIQLVPGKGVARELQGVTRLNRAGYRFLGLDTLDCLLCVEKLTSLNKILVANQDMNECQQRKIVDQPCNSGFVPVLTIAGKSVIKKNLYSP